MPLVVKDEHQFKITQDCITSIKNNSTNHDVEIIIVIDNAIIDAWEWMKEQGCICIQYPFEFIFAALVNYGIASSKGEYIIIMNNDTIVDDPGWLDKMIKKLNCPGIGATSPYVNNQSAGNPEMWEKNFIDNAILKRPLNMICVMFKRSVYDIIGPLDQDFDCYGGEDVDYSLRIVKAGYDISLINSKLTHLKHQSWQDNTNIEPGNDIFKNKWGVSLIQDNLLLDMYQIKPEISVIMTTYNQSKYIMEAIKSIQDQTFKNWELIINIDGSPDDTFNLLKTIKDRRIRVINNKHQGYAKSMIFLRRECKGNYVCSISSDDVMYPDSLECRYRARNLADIVFGKTLVFNENLSQPFNEIGEPFNLNKMITEGNYIAMDGCIYKTDLYFKIGEYDPSVEYGLDYEWFLRAYVNGYKFHFIDKVLLKYRRHSSNMSFGSKDAHIAQREIMNRYKKYLTEVK